jgi:hypothetical protein
LQGSANCDGETPRVGFAACGQRHSI